MHRRVQTLGPAQPQHCFRNRKRRLNREGVLFPEQPCDPDRSPAPRKKLERAFEIRAVRPFEMMMTSPEAKELAECNFPFLLPKARDTGVQKIRADDRAGCGCTSAEASGERALVARESCSSFNERCPRLQAERGHTRRSAPTDPVSMMGQSRERTASAFEAQTRRPSQQPRWI